MHVATWEHDPRYTTKESFIFMVGKVFAVEGLKDFRYDCENLGEGMLC
jgi:hypothetical protein